MRDIQSDIGIYRFYIYICVCVIEINSEINSEGKISLVLQQSGD